MTSVKSIIDQSLRKLGALGSGEQAGTEEHADALAALRIMLDTWSIEALMVPFLATEEFPLSPDQALYAMGPLGDWVTTRPMRIEQIRVKGVDGRTRYLPQSTPSALRHQTSVEPGYPSAWVGSADGMAAWIEINAYPVEPAVLVTSRKPFDVAALDNFALPHDPAAAPETVYPSGFTLSGIQTTLAFPPGYEAAIIYNLAVHLAPEYKGLQLSQIVVEQAARAKALIKIGNVQPRDLVLDPFLTGRRGGYDIQRGPN